VFRLKEFVRKEKLGTKKNFKKNKWNVTKNVSVLLTENDKKNCQGKRISRLNAGKINVKISSDKRRLLNF
jgi:hypothetical protein